ncbi:glycosyltransferase involved in cell wall biosynthesis [Flavobacteriaceae bacterium MAR_2010_105]|nr:glycosyltransferase involved in cell wall biosynthesis [Flavobacteriaceae bacterium MAR_2010_105]
MNLPLTHTQAQGVSIVIVTYNGRDRLAVTLEHLAQQTDLDFMCELLVIDNNSDDGTADFVRAHWAALKEPYPLRIQYEHQAGTMYARETGIALAQYRYLLFCDDDNWLPPEYVSIAFRLISQHAQIAAVGGKGIITYASDFEVPTWMCERYERSYGCGAQGKADGDTTHDKGCLYTAGAIFDRVWLDRLYRLGFKTSLKGRDGQSLVAGEDTELTMALILIGGQLHYSSALHFKHYMPSGRIQWDYLKRLWFAFGQSNYVLEPYYRGGYSNKIITYYKILVTTFLRFVYHSFNINIRGYKEGDQNLLLYVQLKGCLYALLFRQRQYIRAKTTVHELKEKSHV